MAWRKIICEYGVFIALAAIFGACTYEAPTAGSGGSGASASTSGAMGGSGQTSSSSGDGAGGGPSGSGGFGGKSSSSSSSGDGSGGLALDAGLPMPEVSCPGIPCPTRETQVCCGSPVKPDATCSLIGTCSGDQVTMTCDDTTDCAFGFKCCWKDLVATCAKGCLGNVLCKLDNECPMGNTCTGVMGVLKYCTQ